MIEHADHWPWKQIGNCVYCSCGERLYQGKVPKTQEDGRLGLASLEKVFESVRKEIEAGKL